MNGIHVNGGDHMKLSRGPDATGISAPYYRTDGTPITNGLTCVSASPTPPRDDPFYQISTAVDSLDRAMSHPATGTEAIFRAPTPPLTDGKAQLRLAGGVDFEAGSWCIWGWRQRA